MELTYRMQGDYRLPNLIPPESPKVGKYGMLRHSYLRKHREGLYTGMLMEGTLNAHPEEVDREANRMLEQLTVGEQIDYYNAHGTGTPVNDRTEQLALTETFGERAASIPVTSVKGILGHTIGASGANEALFCQQFLDKHPMKCVRGRLFTVDGLIEDEGQIGNLILRKSPEFWPPGCPKL